MSRFVELFTIGLGGALTSRGLLGAMLAALVAVSGARAGTTNTWVPLTGTNYWNTAGNWSPSGPPVSDAATILDFTNSTAGVNYGASNDISGTFFLNQVNFTNAASGKTISLLANALAFTNNGATLPTFIQGGAGAVTIATPLTLATNTTFGGGGAGGVTIQALISGPGCLIKEGSYTLTLTNAANTYSGGTTVNVGRLVLSGSAVSVLTNTLSVASGATVEFNTAGASFANGFNITGAGTLVKSGNGVLYFSISYAKQNVLLGAGGLIDVQGGTLRDNNFSQNFVNNFASLNIANGAKVDLWYDHGHFDALTGAGVLTNGGTAVNMTLGVANGSGAFSGAIGGASSLFKVGTGTQTLAGVSTYNGPTTISNGFIAVSNNLAMSTNVVTLTGGGLMAASGSWAITNVVNMVSNATFATTGNLALMGVVTNRGALTKTGAGILTLNATNTYSGGTTVNNGTLLVNGAITGTVTVAGGTLGGTGVVAGVVTNSATIGAADAGSAGTLTVTNLVMKESSACVWNYDATTNDVIQVTGSLYLPSVATVTVSRVAGGTWPANPAVLFNAGSLTGPGAASLATWVVTGDCRPGSKVITLNNQVKLVSPTGLIIKIN